MKIESQKPPETLGTPEKIVSSFAVVLDELQDPPWVFLFHVNDEYEEGEEGEDDDVAQPAGFKLPGGGYEIPRDESPRHTAQNETLLEIGLNTEPAKLFNNCNSPYGESLLECKTFVDKKGQVFFLKVYTFFMKRTDSAVAGTIEKNEGGARGSFSLTDILLMPLARNTKTGELSPYGIHFSARKRIFITLKRAGYDFLELIPNLPELIDRIDWEEVGEEVYWILRDALDTPGPESTTFPKEEEPTRDYSESFHEKTCPCDPCWQRWWDNGLISA